MGSRDYSRTPLSALRHSTRGLLSQLLNGVKIIPSPSNLPRDWRGLAHIARVTCPHVGCVDPTAAVLSAWEKQKPSIQELLDALKEIDRWDVIDDIADLIEKDVADHGRCIENSQYQVKEESDEIDSEILTVDDLQCIESCGKPKYYDAFLLYDDSDREFALEMLYKLENEYGMKICTKDRDLIGGLPFEHVAIMQLIRDRCRRLIVVVSPVFLESPANKFFISFAQAVGVEQQQRKIIPCVYLNFRRPPQLAFYFVLDFTRTSQLWNHWERLSQSLRAASPRPTLTYNQPRAILPASPLESTTSNGVAGALRNETFSPERWECPEKKQHIPNSYNGSLCVSEINSSFSQADVSMPASQVELSETSIVIKEESPLSTGESLSGQSETDPIIKKSTNSSTATMLSKVFISKRFIKPKSWFKKKKKKTPVPVSS